MKDEILKKRENLMKEISLSKLHLKNNIVKLISHQESSVLQSGQASDNKSSLEGAFQGLYDSGVWKLAFLFLPKRLKFVKHLMKLFVK